MFHSSLKLELCRHACRRRDPIILTCRYGKTCRPQHQSQHRQGSVGLNCFLLFRKKWKSCSNHKEPGGVLKSSLTDAKDYRTVMLYTKFSISTLFVYAAWAFCNDDVFCVFSDNDFHLAVQRFNNNVSYSGLLHAVTQDVSTLYPKHTLEDKNLLKWKWRGQEKKILIYQTS